MSELPPEDRDESDDPVDEGFPDDDDELGDYPSASPHASHAAVVEPAAPTGSRVTTTDDDDPYPRLPEFERRVHGVWNVTGALFAAVVIGLWISGFDPQGDGLAALFSRVAFTNFLGHVFSLDAVPISVTQYALLVLGMVTAVRLGQFLIAQYDQIETRLAGWAKDGFPGVDSSRKSKQDPVGRIQSQIASGRREGGRVPDREALLEEFDAEFERRYAPLRHLAGVAIFFGLLGTFWGLQTHAGGLASAGGLGAVKDIAAAMHTAFACSIVGVLSALLLGFLSLRMYGAAATLRQRLDHVLTVQLLPGMRENDVTSPLIDALAELHEAIQSMGNVGASVERLPDLLTEMRGLLATWTTERALTTGALSGLENAVAGLDGLHLRLDESTTAMTSALEKLRELGASWTAQAESLTKSVTTIGDKFDGAIVRVEAIAVRASAESQVALAESRELIAETVADLNAAHMGALGALQASHKKALEELLKKQGDGLAPIVAELKRRDEDHRKLLAEIRDALKKGDGRRASPRPEPYLFRRDRQEDRHRLPPEVADRGRAAKSPDGVTPRRPLEPRADVHEADPAPLRRNVFGWVRRIMGRDR